jgi:hypothetical protein
MPDTTHAGSRCRTLQFVRTVKGDLPCGSQGTVIHELDNLGCRLVLVHWDTGIVVSAFPNEIELTRRNAEVVH